MPVVFKPNSPGAKLRVCCIVGIISVWILLALNIQYNNFSLFLPQAYIGPHFINESMQHTGFLVNTKGCRIPDLHPFDASVQSFIFTPKETIDCAAKYGPALLESNLTFLYVTHNESILDHYNITDLGLLSCCYTPFWRHEHPIRDDSNYPSNVDFDTRFAIHCTSFSDASMIPDEFVRAECFYNNVSIYIDYHAFVPLNMASPTPEAPSEEVVSILILGVDAVSRLNFHRQMPLTAKYLKKDLSSVEMLGYNKVDDNTFPNLMPVLAGISEQEAKKSCWPKANSVFDNCPFVWYNFSSAGFKTAFGEDATWMGIFSYLRRGFREQPTDYYLKVFDKWAEDDIGFDKRLNAKLCIGPRKTLETLLNYALKFALAMKGLLSFGFFWGASLTHDFLNYPRFGDDDHKKFLESLNHHGIFNRTILIFMSDHGIRWGSIRQTYQGYLEERLPFVFISYPDWFRKKFTTAVRNLERNTQKLTTPYDLHETLLDLLNLTRIEKESIKARSGEMMSAKPPPRGISLFLPIPQSRTCAEAGINDHWCTCHQSELVSNLDPQVQSAALHLVKYINSILKAYPQCARLKLNHIQSARLEKSISLANFSFSDKGVSDYSLTIETTPGKALFESTVRYNANSGNFSTVGTISRINLYGEQSQCVSQYKIRLYCYCNHD